MRDIYRVILFDLFQWLIVLSVPAVLCFFWPNHDIRLMKFICFQTFITVLLLFSFLFTPQRRVDNIFPFLFMIVGFVNLFTHGVSNYVNVGLGFFLPAITGIYVLSNHLHKDFVPILKKVIVITCLVNCALFLSELMNYYHYSEVKYVFDIGEHGRPSGFLSYPVNFSLLCAVSLCFTWNWKKWLCIPIGACLLLSQEYSVFVGLIVAVSMPFLRGHLKYLVPIALIGAIYLVSRQPEVAGKMALRMKYLTPVFQNIWARPLDGWGVGMYNRLPDSFFGFIRGNWSEMHCEPLDLFFSMGVMGLSVVGGWIYSVRKMNKEYLMMFIVMGFTACFHSILHFSDSLWLCVIIYSLMEISREQSTAH